MIDQHTIGVHRGDRIVIIQNKRYDGVWIDVKGCSFPDTAYDQSRCKAQRLFWMNIEHDNSVRERREMLK